MNNVGSLSEMVNSSIVVLTKPRVSTFEMFERRGNVQSALVYVGIASVISGILAAIGPRGGLTGLLGGLIAALIGFLVFTGAVFYIGRSQGGTGTFDEVAYTFSLFWAPIAVMGGIISLLAKIPILGCIVGLPLSLALLVAEIYFGFLAVQSSMNLIDRTKAIVTLILAALVSLVFSIIMAVIF